MPVHFDFCTGTDRVTATVCIACIGAFICSLGVPNDQAAIMRHVCVTAIWLHWHTIPVGGKHELYEKIQMPYLLHP